MTTAAFDVDGDGMISDAELHKFNEVGSAFIQARASGVLTYSIISALILSLAVTIFTLHTSAKVYETEGDDSVVLVGHSTVQSAAGDPLPHLSGVVYPDVLGDLASFLYPHDVVDAASVRASFYVGECVTISIMTLTSAMTYAHA